MYNKQTEAAILYLYLVKERSHRFIEQNVLNLESAVRGG